MRLPWRDVDGIETTMTAAEIERLRELAAGARVLEIGSGNGYSAIHMALAGAKLVVAVDPHAGEVPNSWLTMQRNIDRYQVREIVRVFRAPSRVALPLLVTNSFDLVFVDGDHSAEAVAYDIREAWRLIDRGGTVACHDYFEEYCTEVGPTIDRWRQGDDVVDTLWLARRS